ncbi:MAG: DinB family protein [Acidobacteria bacterium]|nr:DinB family protein [Acidobacteriota bacterium]
MTSNVAASPQEYKELVASLEDAPRVIRQLVGGLDDKDVRERPQGIIWSIVEHICHLRDIEKDGYRARITKLLNEDQPFLEDLDGDRLAVERAYINQDLNSALEVFIDTRAVNIEAIRDLSAVQLNKSGMFENVGHLTLAELLNKMREHDREHINELTQLRLNFTTDG